METTTTLTFEKKETTTVTKSVTVQLPCYRKCEWCGDLYRINSPNEVIRINQLKTSIECFDKVPMEAFDAFSTGSEAIEFDNAFEFVLDRLHDVYEKI